MISFKRVLESVGGGCLSWGSGGDTSEDRVGRKMYGGGGFLGYRSFWRYLGMG